MEATIIHNSDRSAAILSGLKAIVTYKKTPRATVPTEVPQSSSGKIAFWGDDNDFPQKVIEDVRKDSELGPLLNKKADLLYAGGIVWGIPDFDDQGNEFLRPLPDKEENRKIARWMDRSRINSRYLHEGSVDLFWFFNAFPELILSNDRSEIVQLCIQAAEDCRWELQNSAGIVPFCYISKDWPSATEKTAKKVPVLDPYYDPADSLRKIKSGNNFIYPLSIPTPGSTYYQVADWNGLREGGWLAISQAIPKFKINLLENQLNIKYHIEILDDYWSIKFNDWESLSDAEKKVRVDGELTNFTNVMSGVEKSGNSLVTAMSKDVATGKEFSMWKINVIDNKIKNGEFLEEGKDASLQKMAAVGLHSALVGTMPNDGMGGAGSNIREAYNLNNFINRPKQEILLEPLGVVRDYNGWNPDCVFRIRNSFMNTLDKGKETASTAPVKPTNKTE